MLTTTPSLTSYLVLCFSIAAVQFRSLFASTCELGVVYVMWDLYLLERDPFLVLFLALVMILNAK